MTDDNFIYDPEGEEQQGSRTKFLRLPFALCKKYNIPIEDWWRPRDAWNALRRGGKVESPSEAMKKMLKNMKKEQAKERRERQRQREEQNRKQLQEEEHTPEKTVSPIKTTFANVERGEKMDHTAADSGKVNPFFGSDKHGYRTNCQTCVAAYVARRQGWDVRALPNLNNRAIAELSYASFSIYEGARKILRQSGERKTTFLERNVKEGEIRALRFGWAGKRDGHIVVAMRDKDGVYLYDPQVNKTVRGAALNRYMRRTTREELTGDLTNVRLKKDIADKIFKKGSAKNDD